MTYSGKAMGEPSKLWEVVRDLISTATGRLKADLVISNGSLVDVYTGTIVDGVSVAVKGDRIAHVGKKVDHLIGSGTRVIDARGMYLVPGFIDGHVHIESSMLVPSSFAKAVLPHGTTAVFADPHEIANVAGLDGIRFMIEDSRGLPLKVYITVPSCVPASLPEFETCGASIGPDEVREVLGWERVVALGEVMNYPGVLSCDDRMIGEIVETLKAGRVVEGHYAARELEESLSAYAAAGITSCHESVRREEALEKLRRGMWVMIREGSAWHDLKEVIRVVTEHRVDTRRVVLVTDDRHPEDILEEGHVDHVVRRAIEEGVDPIKAIQMVTLNVAEHYGMSLDLGGIAPPRYADILVVEDLAKVRIRHVIACGKLVASDGRLLVDIRGVKVPERLVRTVRVGRRFSPKDFSIRAPVERGRVKAHVIKAIEASVETRHLLLDVEVEGYEVRTDPERDVAKVAVIERYTGRAGHSVGLVTGFGLRTGAIAMSVAHDSHNIVVVGVDEGDMALAVNRVVELNGGIVIAREGRIEAQVELPVAGLMSPEEPESVASRVRRLMEAWELIGRKMVSPFMTISLLPLSVLPELRITDKGLIDTVEFRKIPVIEDSKA